MFNEIAIDIWSSWNFTCMKNIITTCNLMVRFSKFTLNIKIYEEFVEFLSKLIWRETLFLNNLSVHLNLDPFGMSMVSDDKMVFMVCVCVSLSLFGLVVSKISLNQLILFELGLVWLMGCNHFVKRLKPNKKI